MSITGKKWIIKNTDLQKDLMQRLLINRGLLTVEDQEEFLGIRTTNLHDPFLFRDMAKGVSRIEQAINNKERIIIFGDYDVDGISGTALLVHSLTKVGAQVSYRLPHRVEDGYGLSSKFVEVFKEAGANLIITVDCGISNYQQVAELNALGIDTIITDHHSVPANMPQAHAIIHPKVPGETYPFDGLTGSGVAFKLAQALYIKFNLTEHLAKLIDLASLGTVADMGPLKGENRLIVKKGLEALKNTNWRGLELIKQKAGLNAESIIDTGTIGFQISPRINAAGRIDTPYLALQLLLHEEEKDNSRGMADKLEELNIKRQGMTKLALEELADFVLTLTQPKVIIKASAAWHIGIVGLIAGKAVEQYGVPAIIMQDFGDHLVGSCRSPHFVNITEALRAHKDLLESFGGHENAAGFTLKKDNFTAFTESLQQYFDELLKEKLMLPELHIECELSGEQISLDLVKSLQQLAPFGIENKRPIFLFEDCEINNLKRVGSSGNHLKLTLQKENRTLEAIAFSFGEHYQKLREHKKIRVAAQLDTNTWNEKESLQLKIEDIDLI